MAQAGIGWAQPDVEQQQIERARQMAMALRQQAQPQGQSVSGHYIAPSWTEQLASALSPWAADQADKRTDERQTALAEKLRTQGMQDIQDFTAAGQAQPARTIQPLTPNDDEGNAMPSVDVAAQAPDRQKQLAIALGSRNPMLQQAGGTLLTSMMPKAPAYDVVERFNDKTGAKEKVIIDKNNPSAAAIPFGGTEAVKGISVNGQIVDPTKIGQTVAKQPDAPNAAKDLLLPDGKGGYVPNSTLVDLKKQIAASGKTSVNVGVNNIGPKEFEKELGQLDAKQLGKYRDSAEVAQSTIGTVQALRDAEKQGVYSGGGANAKLAVANIINGFTGVEPKGLVGSQVYNAEASKLVLDRIKALGTNPSNADREFIEKTVPQLATSATARTQMADYMEKKAQQQIDLYKRADSYARKNHGLGGFEAFNTPAPVGGNVLDAADAILKGSK
jgi:hypothetical protein